MAGLSHVNVFPRFLQVVHVPGLPLSRPHDLIASCSSHVHLVRLPQAQPPTLLQTPNVLLLLASRRVTQGLLQPGPTRRHPPFVLPESVPTSPHAAERVSAFPVTRLALRCSSAPPAACGDLYASSLSFTVAFRKKPSQIYRAPR